MSIRLWRTAAIIVVALAPARGSAQDTKPPGQKASDALLVTPQMRLDNIARASLFDPLDIAKLDTRAGRQAEQRRKNIPNDVTIECYYDQEPPGGTTEKFKCVGAPDPKDPKAHLPIVVTDRSGKPVDVSLDKIKVRYGSVKVFSAVIATRLAWALGFGSDVETPVAKVICHGCSDNPFKQQAPVAETHEFPLPGDRPQVSIEQSMPGTEIIVPGMRFMRDDGEDTPSWGWEELVGITDHDRAAQADALKLFAAFIQHVDSKSVQNKLVCRSEADSSGACSDPFLYVHDFGNTLGTLGGLLHSTGGILAFLGNLLGVHTIHPLDLQKWTEVKVWKNEPGCVANLGMDHGDGPGLINPVISEGGRRLLAERLTMLIAARDSAGSSKLRDIFDAAHIEKYDDHGHHFTADDWVDVFVMRAKQITEKAAPCP